MPYSPLVSKIRCHHPNKQKSRVCNRNYLVYIATREGVDLSDVTYLKIEQQMETLDDGNVSIESANELYAKYIAERPGSHGLFGNFNVENLNAVANNLADLTASGKTIYRGIVSLSEQDALALGYAGNDNAKDKWVQFMRSTMPDVAKQFNIPIDKLKWTAAIHMEKHHPHCHYMFWHDGDAITNPYIHISKQNACRELLSKEMFREEREQEQINKTLYRDLLLDTGHKILEKETSEIMAHVSTSNRSLIMGRINNDTLQDFGNKLLLLSAQLPTSGRLNYQLLPPDVKSKVDNFVSELLQEKELRKEYLSYLQTADNISRTYSVSENHFKVNHEKADEDMRKRLANTVLKSCRNLTRDYQIFDKYVNRADLLSSATVISDQSISEPSSDKALDISDLPDISEYDDLDFIYAYNCEYKKALKYIYDPKIKDIPKAVSILNNQAAKNNILACMELGKLYVNEIVPNITTGEALKIGHQFYKKAYAGLMHLEAEKPKSSYEYKLGKLLEKGYGTPIDYEKARYYYQLSSDKENKYARYSLGSMYLYEKIAPFNENNRKDLIKAGIKYIKQSADQNFAYAAYTYAKFCETESFLSLTDKELKHYYSIALEGFKEMLNERRDDNLLYRIGTMYYNGQGTASDHDIAYNYFKEAADLNNVNAQYALGKTYSDQESKYFDIDKAIKYFQLAAKKNNIYAMASLGDIYSNSTLAHYDVNKAIEYYQKSLNQGNEFASYRLGILYSNPDLNCYDMKKAINYLELATQKGNDLAAYKLGNIYSTTDSEYYDLKKAIHYLDHAAKYENDFAYYKLGIIYLEPNSIYYNPSHGLDYLKKAMNAGNIYAQAKLGNLYLWGKHPAIEKDVEKGLTLLQMAAAEGNEYAQTSLDIYRDIQNNTGNNLLIKAGYTCFRSAFATLTQHRRTPDPYTDPAIRNIGKAARKAMATRMGKYVNRDTT